MKRWFVIVILAVSQFVMVLDSTVMNVSISQVAHDLDTTITGMQAAITFYTLTMLLFGWSLVEGLGAVLVIPAIAALAAINYSGKARVAAFSILGAVTGLAAAAGPLIGGLVTTYASWRYVFVAETVIMIAVLILSG